ncbi:MAG: helix-turn-helix domain-containing protein [Gammaproteobacteria bacterium]
MHHFERKFAEDLSRIRGPEQAQPGGIDVDDETAPRPAWFATDWVLGQFGSRRPDAIRRYEDFVRAGVGLPSIWEELTGQIFLGSEDFANEMRKVRTDVVRLREVPRAQRRPVAKPLIEYAGHGRKGMAMAYLSGDYTIQSIADHFGVHYSTVSRAIKQFEKQMP